MRKTRFNHFKTSTFYYRKYSISKISYAYSISPTDSLHCAPAFPSLSHLTSFNFRFAACWVRIRRVGNMRRIIIKFQPPGLFLIAQCWLRELFYSMCFFSLIKVLWLWKENLGITRVIIPKKEWVEKFDHIPWKLLQQRHRLPFFKSITRNRG